MQESHGTRSLTEQPQLPHMRQQSEETMHILVTGAAGVIGRKFVERLAREGRLGGRPVEAMTLTDIVAPVPPKAAFSVAARADDLAAPGIAEALVKGRPQLIVHLAAIVSGE